MEKSRLRHIKPINFSNRVLIGNWFEEKCSYKKNNFQHSTSYSNDYTMNPITTNNSDIIWDAKIKAEGHGFYPGNTNEDIPNFYENFTSSYDLSYNHFPKWYCHPSHENSSKLEHLKPADKYLKSYGNLTKIGLCDYKKQSWSCENQDPRTTATTVSENTYSPLDDSGYQFVRWTLPTAIKSKYGKVNKKYPPDHPRFSKYNPITWEYIIHR